MICVRRTLIQRRDERAKRRCPRDAGRTNGSGVHWRRVREDVRAKKERPDPGRGQRRNLRKAGCELRPGNERGLRSMFIAASGNQCDRTTVLRAIRVAVNARVQLRRNAQRERPEKGCGNKCRDKSTPAIVWTRQAVHRSPSLRQRRAPRKQFLGAHASSRALRGELSQKDGALSALHLRGDWRGRQSQYARRVCSPALMRSITRCFFQLL